MYSAFRPTIKTGLGVACFGEGCFLFSVFGEEFNMKVYDRITFVIVNRYCKHAFFEESLGNLGGTKKPLSFCV